MADTIKIKAAEGRRVLDPKTKRPIPDEGITVLRRDVFWFRRLQCGDVVEVEEPAPAPEPQTEQAAAPVTEASH